MSDFDRNAVASRYSETAGREAAAVDQGLRAYMLHIYNYMVLGLAITGFAALGIFMLSITGDAAAAAKSASGAAIALRGGQFLTPLGYAIFVSPLKWAIILAPLALVFVLSFGIERMRPASIKSRACSACRSVSATTSATLSPIQRTIACASRGSNVPSANASGPHKTGLSKIPKPYSFTGTSFAVKIATTPGAANALDVSICVMRACGRLANNTFIHS